MVVHSDSVLRDTVQVVVDRQVAIKAMETEEAMLVIVQDIRSAQEEEAV